MTYESFSDTKNKIENNWNSTEKNLVEEKKLVRQQNNSLQNNFNPRLITIPLINHKEVKTIDDDGDIGLYLLKSVQNFTISNMTEDLLPFTRVIQKIYREIGDNPVDVFLQFKIYISNDILWKYINNSTMILQTAFPTISFQNQTFMDIDLYIKNPNVYTALPKLKI